MLCSSTWEGHLQLLEHMFKVLQTAGVTLHPSKAQLGPQEVKCLGHILTADGIWIVEDRMKVILLLNLPTQRTVEELR